MIKLFLTALLTCLTLCMFGQDAFHEFNPDQRIYAKNRIQKVIISLGENHQLIQQINEQGLIVKTVRVMAGDTVSVRYISYDDQRRVSHLRIDSLTLVEKRFYYDNNGKLSSIYVTEDGKEDYISYQFETTNNSLREFRNDVETCFATFDEHGRFSSLTMLDEERRETFKQVYERNKTGFVTSIVEVAMKPQAKGHEVHQRLFSLNERGQPVSSTLEPGGMKETYRYNERNLLVERMTVGRQITYRYDHFGE